MASLAEQLQQALNSHRPVVAVPDVIEFRCGKMKLEGTMVQPDLRKGKITIKTAEADGCLHFIWTERNTNMAEAEDDLILFPGDATFVRVEAARNNAKNNRVFALKFAATKKVHFFWMQEPNKDKDDELVRKINIKMNGEEAAAPAASNVHQMDQASLLALFEQGRQQNAAANASTSGANASAPGAAGDASAPAPSGAADSASATAASTGSGAGGEGQSGAGTERMDVDPPPSSDQPPSSAQ